MELNESDPQSPLFVFQVHFNIILPSILVCEASTFWNAVFAHYQENGPTAKRVYLWVSLSLLVYSKQITGQYIYFKKRPWQLLPTFLVSF